MKFIVRKAGGVFGSVRPSAQLDSTSLSADERRELDILVEAARFWELPAELPTNLQARDALGTILEIEDGERTHTVGFELPTAPEPLRELVTKVRAMAGRVRDA